MKKLTKRFIKRYYGSVVKYSDNVVACGQFVLYVSSIAEKNKEARQGVLSFLSENNLNINGNESSIVDTLATPDPDKDMLSFKKTSVLWDQSSGGSKGLLIRAFVNKDKNIVKWINEEFVNMFELDTVQSDAEHISVYFEHGCVLLCKGPSIDDVNRLLSLSDSAGE